MVSSRRQIENNYEAEANSVFRLNETQKLLNRTKLYYRRVNMTSLKARKMASKGVSRALGESFEPHSSSRYSMPSIIHTTDLILQ